MRIRYRGGRGIEEKHDIPAGKKRRSSENPPADTALWITIIGLLGGAVVRDLARPDSRLRSFGQRLFRSNTKSFRIDNEVRAIEGPDDLENGNEPEERPSFKITN